MAEPDSIEDLRARVTHIEAHLSKPSWLDEPAIIDGEPFVMGTSIPTELKVILWLFGFAGAIGLGFILISGIHYSITGRPF